MQNPIQSIALVLFLTLTSGVAAAIDIPQGGDAIFYQLRASSDAAIMKFVRQDAKGFHFETVSALRGQVGKQLSVPDDGYLGSLRLQPGQSYLLYLRDGTLATSLYSMHKVLPAEQAVYKEVIGAYTQNLEKREALKPTLKKNFTHKVPYIQYSAVADLMTLQLVTNDDLQELGKLMGDKKIVDPRARQMIINQIGIKQLKQFTPTLDKVVRDKSEPVFVRSAAVDALTEMKAKDTLQKLGPVIDQDQSLTLKRKVLQESAEKLK